MKPVQGQTARSTADMSKVPAARLCGCSGDLGLAAGAQPLPDTHGGRADGQGKPAAPALRLAGEERRTRYVGKPH